MGIYSEKAPVIIAGSVGAYGTARISGNIVAVKAEALKLYQCDVTASGSVGIAVDELGVANEAHLTAIGRSLAIQANTLLMTADKVHCNEPLDKWQLGVLEDCANETRKVLVALSAMETSILGHLAMMLATIWANNVLLVANTPTCLSDGLLALVIRVEIRG